MRAMDKLSAHLERRSVDLEKAKAEGRKIIGYTPGGYLPEELVLASGAIPVGLIRGGDHSMVEFAENYICHWIDTFCRSQIGYGISGKDPYFKIIDLLVQYAEKEIRIPILALESDLADSRVYSAKAQLTRVEAFAEMLRAKKTVSR